MEISKCLRFEGSLGSALLSRITIYYFGLVFLGGKIKE